MRNRAASTATNECQGKVLQFDRLRLHRRSRPSSSKTAEERHVVAVVTVTRFIGNDKVHAQVPVFADEVLRSDATAADLNITPELSELLADGAVEANAYLDRLTATRASRPLDQFYR